MPAHTATRALAGIEGYRRLARILVRLFYADECPPKEDANTKQNGPGGIPIPGEQNGGADNNTTNGPAKRFQKHTFEYLGIVLIDYLVSPKIDGYVDEIEIAADLRLGQKAVRKALRYLEGEHLVSSESVKFSLKRKNAITPDDPEIEEKKRQETHVFWCIDYPRMVDMIQLRLHRMRETLKKGIEDAEALQRYICSRCGAIYSSLDAMSLLDPMTGSFKCEHCHSTDVHEYVEGPGTQRGTLSKSSRRERQAFYKDLSKRMEDQVRPLTEQLAKLRGTPPPDYGSLQDWYQGKKEEAVRRAKCLEAARRKLAAGGTDAAEMTEDQLLEWAEKADVVIALPGTSQDETKKTEEAEKELPMWFRTEEETTIGSVSFNTGTQMLSEDVQGARHISEEINIGTGEEREEERIRQQQYLEQYLLQVKATIASDSQPSILETDTKKPTIKMEQKDGFPAKEEEPMEGIEWEDVEDKATLHVDKRIGSNENNAEDHDWEDV